MALDCIGKRVADWARAGIAKLLRLVDVIVEFSFEVSTIKTIPTDKQSRKIEMRCSLEMLKMLKMEVMIGGRILRGKAEWLK